MAFAIDKQTLEELNLLNKFRLGSVYTIFNRVKTRGGEQLLDAMFRQPLTDTAAINQRTAIFRFFQEARLSFPFDVQEVNSMREYLDTGAGSNALLSLSYTLVKKMLASLTRDERYKKTVQGFQATIGTLNRCYSFLERLTGTGLSLPAGPLRLQVNATLALLDEPRLKKLRQIDIYSTLPVRTLAWYDHELKTVLLEAMENILTFIGELDVYIAVSEVAGSRGFSYAVAHPAEANVFSATGLYHPAIEGGIGNRLTLDGASNVFFLTGANMAGKSTLMKAVGIGIYLAHMGFPVAAENLEFSVRDGLYSSINVADNIGLGYSHFYAEVVRVKQAAEAAASGKRLLLMFDELFKGTNVKDAYDGTLAVTEAFAEYRNCLFIVSTHIIEVGEALRALPNIQFGYMPTIMEGAHPRYTYHLQAGITEDRQGMLIIRNEGILDLLSRE